MGVTETAAALAAGATSPDLSALECDLKLVAGLLAREYGMPAPASQGMWSPDTPMFVAEGTLDVQGDVDVQSKMPYQRLAVRGHILNIGVSNFQVILHCGQNGTATGKITLLPSVPFPITVNLQKVTIVPASGSSASYQIVAQ